MKFISEARDYLSRPRTWQYILLGLNIMLIGPALAANSVSLKQALDLTLRENIELKAYPFAIRGSEAMSLQAEVNPSPLLKLELENALGNGDYQGFDSSEISLSYSQQIELGNKQQNRVNFATAKTKQLQSEYQLARLDVLAETTRRYYQGLMIQQRLTAISQRIISEREALSSIKKRATAGAVGAADVSKMSLRTAHSVAEKQRLENQLQRAKIRLAGMWMAQAEFELVPFSSEALLKVPSEKTLLDAIEALPSMQHQLALQRIADTGLLLAQSNGQSNITVGVGLKQHQRTSDQSLNFSVSMPLTFSNPNRGRIKAAQIEINKSSLQSEMYKRQLALALIEIRQNMLGLNQQLDFLTKELSPQAEKLLLETKKGYQKGRYSVLQWIDAQSELFSIEQSLISIRWNIRHQFLELQRITGQSMSTETSSKGLAQ
jgi:outer membrane protein, heavy metal efflux system